jgi:hypothetical protein
VIDDVDGGGGGGGVDTQTRLALGNVSAVAMQSSMARWRDHGDVTASFDMTPVRVMDVDVAFDEDPEWGPFQGAFTDDFVPPELISAGGCSEFLLSVTRCDVVWMNQYAAQPTCNIHAVDHVNKNAMMFAAALRLDAALQWCVERGVGGSVDAVSDHAWTALMFACASGWGVPATRADVSTCASLLVRAGADVNHRSASGDTALHVAAHAGYRHIVAFLLSVEGVDIGVRNGRGQTAEECAVTARHHSVASMLATRSTRQ